MASSVPRSWGRQHLPEEALTRTQHEQVGWGQADSQMGRATWGPLKDTPTLKGQAIHTLAVPLSQALPIPVPGNWLLQAGGGVGQGFQ